jgi:hypothetical protein
MSIGLSLELRPRLAQEQHLEQRLIQAVECTLELRQELQDPFEYARELYESSAKVNVPMKIGRYTIGVKAAIVPESELEKLFEGERFAGIMASTDERYQFFNKTIKVPPRVAPFMAELMAFHCLASIRVKSFGDETGTLSQYQAIALEMAYARSKMDPETYSVYERWRQGIERSGFFQRSDWQEIVAMTSKRFRDIVEDVHGNALKIGFLVTMSGGRLMLTPEGARNRNEEIIPIIRKQVYKRR